MSEAVFVVPERWQPHAAPLSLARSAIVGVSEPTDVLEREADHVADSILAHLAPVKTLGTAMGNPAVVHRQEAGSAGPPGPPPPEKTNEEKAKEAAEKIGEALLETPLGKELKDKAAKVGEAFVTTLTGAAITGAVVASTAGYMIANDIALPAQIPTIPLTKIAEGLKVKMVLEGPLSSPTSGSLTFTYTPPVGGGGTKKPGPTASEKFRAETARIGAEQAKFREGLKSPGEKTADKAARQAAQDAWIRYQSRPGGPLYIPGLRPATEVPKPKEEEAPIQRKADGGRAAPGAAAIPARVHAVAATGGSALDPAVREPMERSFGRSFADVRVHADRPAEDAAAAVRARAYTLGRHVVFGAGQFRPSTPEGRRLLAHELAHVVQQGRS